MNDLDSSEPLAFFMFLVKFVLCLIMSLWCLTPLSKIFQLYRGVVWQHILCSLQIAFPRYKRVKWISTGFIAIFDYVDCLFYRNISSYWLLFLSPWPCGISSCWLMVLSQYFIMLVDGFIAIFHHVGWWFYRNI